MPSFQPALCVQLGIGGGHHRAAYPQRCRQDAAGGQPLTGAKPPVGDARPELAGDLPGQRDVVPAISDERKLDGGT